ncbi:MAG: ABC transporter substrate-binding protein [Clostridiales bacterium]|nr:ABC transporter substrate-binding protein [Clostridiales bacterium]
MKTAMQGKNGPDIVQVYDIGTRFMVDSGWVVPMQNLIDADKSFNIKTLEPNLLGYYTVDGKLYSMPFNSSTPILYYNKNAFKEAGLDPEKGPVNFKEVEQYAKALTKKDSSGKVTRYGYAMAIYGWFFEQFLAYQGYDYVDNSNGRQGKATVVVWDKGDAKQGALNLLNEWKKLVDSGNAGNFGRKTDDTKNAFIAGRTAMIIESTAALAGLLKGSGNRFGIGTAYLPSISESKDKGSVIIGGASLWAINNGDESKQKAVWEFIKYMISPEQQVIWNSQSGYFPVTTKAYDLQSMQDHLKQFPQFKTAIDQLHGTALTEATKGGCVGVFQEARATVESEIEKMLQNKETPDQAIENAAKTINSAIENYNSNKK